MRDTAHRRLGHACQRGADGLMHYTHTMVGVWCTYDTDVRGPVWDRRLAVVTCLWCLALVAVTE